MITARPREKPGDIIVLTNVSKKFPGGMRPVLEGVTLEVKEGEFLCVVGLSGAGKTTFLRILAGLVAPSSGGVKVAGRHVEGPIPEVLLVFQEYGRSLLPWRRVGRNVELGLEGRAIPARKRREIVQEALEMVGLGEIIRYYPWQLSGGMQQRVALARALACKPKVLLMDEPFGSVDAPTRQRLEDELLALWAATGLTVVLVTHDLDEAVYLGERVALLGGVPASIRMVEEIPLEFPRSQIETRQRGEFLALRSRLYAALHSEVANYRK